MQPLVKVALCGIGLAACASESPESARVENTQTLAATVTAVDLENRLVSLEGENGRTATVEVAPDVKNLPQVAPGDKVVVRYYQAVAAQLKPIDPAGPSDEVDIERAASTAEPGQKPAGSVGTTVTTTVVIDAVDRPSNTVVFRGPSGMLRSVEVADPKMREFVSGLKKGDQVEVTYSEALAVSVEPAP